MIEAIISYIQLKGFTVYVREEGLRIYKEVGEEIVGVSWWIPKWELTNIVSIEPLYTIADGYMKQIDETIAEKASK